MWLYKPLPRELSVFVNPMATAPRIPITTITTINSTKVNPLLRFMTSSVALIGGINKKNIVLV
jgi:hypothetical protein